MMRAMLLHPLRFRRDHRLTQALASEYLDDELDPQRRARIEAHAHVCPACARLLASLRRTIAALRGLGEEAGAPPAPAEGPSVSDGVIARLRSEVDRPPPDG